MNDRHQALRRKLHDERHTTNVNSALMNTLIENAPAKLVFAMGAGAGQLFNMLDALIYIVDIHLPSPRSEFCECCSGDNAPVSWPCPTTKAIASIFRHDHVFVSAWEPGQ